MPEDLPDSTLGEPPTAAEGVEVVRAARAGSREAQQELTEKFRQLLESVLRVRMGSRLKRYAAPEDVAQDAMVNALKALNHLREGAGYADFKAILLRNAEWLLLNAGKRAAAFVAPSEVGGVGTDADRAVSLLSRGPVTVADDRRWLAEKIERLDEKYAVILRAHLSGKNFATIAEELGLLEDTARKRYKRATELLQMILGQESGA